MPDPRPVCGVCRLPIRGASYARLCSCGPARQVAAKPIPETRLEVLAPPEYRGAKAAPRWKLRCPVCRKVYFACYWPKQLRETAQCASCRAKSLPRKAGRFAGGSWRLVACETEPLWRRALMAHRPWSLLGRVT